MSATSDLSILMLGVISLKDRGVATNTHLRTHLDQKYGKSLSQF